MLRAQVSSLPPAESEILYSAQSRGSVVRGDHRVCVQKAAEGSDQSDHFVQ